MSATNTTTGNDHVDDGSGPLFHTFPESKYETICIIVFLLASFGMVGFGIWHYRNEPQLLELSQRNFRNVLRMLFLYYVISLVLILVMFETTEEETFVGFLLPPTIAVEVLINVRLLSKTRERVFPRLGRRFMFVSMCALFGAAIFTNQYNHIDYYGPVRVTSVGLELDRPEQKIDSVNPSYYYYYRLQQKLEWGDSWGCPASYNPTNSWCSTTEELYKETCKKRINCKGRPPADEVGECATPEQQQDALMELFGCWKDTALRKDGLRPEDFASQTFQRDIAPWDDPKHPHTVTRAVSCDYKCQAQITPPPTVLVHEAFVEWCVGFSLLLVGVGLLVYGVVSGQEQQQQQQQQQTTIPTVGGFQRVAHADFVGVTHAVPLHHDLELCERSSGSSIPMAHAAPMT